MDKRRVCQYASVIVITLIVGLFIGLGWIITGSNHKSEPLVQKLIVNVNSISDNILASYFGDQNKLGSNYEVRVDQGNNTEWTYSIRQFECANLDGNWLENFIVPYIPDWMPLSLRLKFGDQISKNESDEFHVINVNQGMKVEDIVISDKAEKLIFKVDGKQLDPKSKISSHSLCEYSIVNIEVK